MITYRIAFVGDEQQVYSKGQEFFAKKNGENENFKIKLVDISKMSELDIKASHFHSLIYDINEVIGTKKDDAIKAILDAKKNMSDLKIFPLSRSEITKVEVENESKRLSELAGKNVKAIPINVSKEEDLKSVFQSVDVASVEYKSLANRAIETYQYEFEQTAGALLEAMEEKSPYTASHFRQVGTYAEAISRYMGKDEQDVAKIKSVAILHDAGKLLMPEELLNNPHMTVGNERNQMALHAELGEVVIAQDLFDLEERGGIVDHHNSRTDNKYAKIIAVADCLDTMTSQRAYNNPKAIQEVFRDLARNMHGRSFTGKDGKEVNLPAQFDKETATTAIIMLANELGSIGYDVRKMLEPTSGNWNKAQDDEINQILNEHANEITVNPNAKEGKYTSLGFRLTQTGHLEFENRPAAVLSRETRIRSEYEFAIFKNSTDEQKKVAKTIMELEANFSPEQLEEFRKSAEARVNSEDEKGMNTVQAGRVIVQNRDENENYSKVTNIDNARDKKNRAEQLLEAAALDNQYNQSGAKRFMNEITRTLELNKEDKEEQRGA